MLKQSTAEKSLQSADLLLENAQRVASDALDGMTYALDQGAERAREASLHLRDSARRASYATSNVIRHDPLKSVLIAAATGAALTALISVLMRSQHRN